MKVPIKQAKQFQKQIDNYSDKVQKYISDNFITSWKKWEIAQKELIKNKNNNPQVIDEILNYCIKTLQGFAQYQKKCYMENINDLIKKTDIIEKCYIDKPKQLQDELKELLLNNISVISKILIEFDLFMEFTYKSVFNTKTID